MKTDRDLLWEAIRSGFENTGASKEEIDLEMVKLHALTSQLEWKPPTPLSDTEYAAKLEIMKKEAPAFLESLLQRKFPPLPPKFTGERN